MSIVTSPQTPVKQVPFGCLFFDPVDKRAHFEFRQYAEQFNASHMDWRITCERSDVPLPLAYERLPGGVYCDPVKRAACFHDPRSAWLFLQLHPNWAVEWLDTCCRDVNDMFHFGTVGDAFNYLRSLGLDTPEAEEANDGQ